jgi:acyl-[acyl-carrier-protein]-phospholipid O-acyltransferase/long-chain-fatty-acid--[acyl-carrier-protein] ligase
MLKDFFSKKNRSFNALNAAQFLGALNDNMFKLLAVFLIINLKGDEYASTILATAGAVFVIPYILLSSASGVLSDRFSKRTIIITMKFFEVLITGFSILAFGFKSELWLYLLLFALGTQATLFAPAKYGIIPELVPEEKVSKANGLLTSFTYLAIILGTFLGSFLADITHKNFLGTSWACFLIGIAGFLASIFVGKTNAPKTTNKIKALFFVEIYKTLALSYKREHLLPSIFGSAFFLFIGAFVQLNIIPFAIESLKLTEIQGGYLFLATAIGIALGSLLAGKISKDRVLPGLSCIAGFFIAFFFLMLYLFSDYFLPVCIILVLLGIFGGLFLIPFDSFIQIASPNARRGQIIGATNFLSFIGVLFASFLLYLFSDVLYLSAASGFAFMGLLTFLFSVITAGRLSDLFLPYLTQKILMHFSPYKLSSLPSTQSLIILKKGNWKDAFMLFALLPKLKIITLRKKLFAFPYINGLASSLGVISEFNHPEETEHWLLKLSNHMKKRDTYICLFLEDVKTRENWLEEMQKIAGNQFNDVVFVHLEHAWTKKRIMKISFTQMQTSVYFTDKPL